ncbi:MAG: peptidase U32 family protein, partial [Chlamydiota bacterium]
MKKKTIPELTAPVGDFASLEAAFSAGADSVYFGVGSLHMRSHCAPPFSFQDLQEVVHLCQKRGVASYATLNALLYDEDIEQMKESLRFLKKAGVSGVIVSDVSAMEFAASLQLPVHVSTQVNIGNIEAVRFFSRFADVIVLARELSLEQIQNICREIRLQNICGPSQELVRIEVFVHGALCVSIAGKCYMSLANYQTSANRGQCYQPCRRKYRVMDEETGQELVIDNQYVMSPKDLCTIGCLSQLVASGISICKIEGRGRSADYVHVVVGAYREALDAISEGCFSDEKHKEWLEKLRSVYNRGFWENGYYLGKSLGEWCGSYGSQATKKKIYIGKITNYFTTLKVAEIKVENGLFQKGEELV